MDIALKRTHLKLKHDVEGLPTNLKIIKAFSDYGVTPLSGARLAEGRAMAASLISPDVVSTETAQGIFDHCGMGLFGVTEAALQKEAASDGDESPLVGIFGMLPVNQLGYDAIYNDTFIGTAPSKEHLCSHTQEPVAIFGWGIASYRRSGAYLFVHLGAMINEYVVPDLRWFTKAATNLGEKLIVKKLQYAPVPGSKIGSLFYPSFNELVAGQSALADSQVQEEQAA